MLHERPDNPRTRGAICLVALFLAISGLGAGIAERNRSSVSSQLAAARAEHRQLLERQQLLVRQAEALKEHLSERSRTTDPAGRTNLQPRPRA